MRRKIHSDTDFDTAYDAVPAQRTGPETAPARPVPLEPRTASNRLVVGRADDPAEATADRMADSALARIRRLTAPETGPSGAAPGPSGAPKIGLAGGQLDHGTVVTIDASRGTALAGPVRGRMEQAFGRSFGAVRIHDGAPAAAAAGAMSARAFTRGSDIFFAPGQFRPDTAEGEHVLAHELAHVVQGGRGAGSESTSTAHRWPWDKKDPAKELAQQKAKQEKQQRKENEKQSKKNYKDEKTRLKGEREVGTAKRDEMREAIRGEQTGGSVTSGKANDLNARFEAALAAEKNLFAMLVESLGEDEARDRAYTQTWLDTTDPELRAIRPPRETAAERLTRDVRQARTGANVRQSTIDANQRGTMLSKSVELVYEAFVVEVDRLMGEPDNLSLTEAETQAQKNVWDIPANATAKGKRPPAGSPLDAQAKKDARQRQQLNPTPPQKLPGLDNAIDKTGTAAPYVGAGEKALGGLSKILDMAGKKETDKLQEGLVAPTEATGGLEQKIPGPVGGFVKSVEDSVSRVKKGKFKDDDERVLPKSVETKAGEGISTSTSILSDLFSTAQALMRFAQAVQKAHADRSPRNVMAATKASADALSAITKTASSTANLAKFIDPGVTSAVGSVIPGFNIFISVMSMISNAMTMGQSATRVQDTDTALAGARQKDQGKAGTPDVMVYPLLRVLQSYTKGLEQAVWNTAISISDFATGIATVATGGGYGIPAAVQAGVKVVDLLHSVGHFIADQVLVSITKEAQSDSLQALEGAAEHQLEKDPAMAVDGIIIRAIKGDPIAEQFLANYELGGGRISRADLDKLNPDPKNVGNEHLFTQIRAAVLAEMAEDADPQYFYEKWAAKAKSLLGTAKKHTTDKWSATGTMATDRNAMDGSAPGQGKRGVAWRLKMMFKGTKKFERSVRKTEVNKAATSPAPAPSGPTVQDNSTMGMDRMTFAQYLECQCGKARLLVGATEQQKQVFASMVDGMPDATIQLAAQDPNNSPEWQEFFRGVLTDRAMQQVGVGV
jgi:hypothetical protein